MAKQKIFSFVVIISLVAVISVLLFKAAGSKSDVVILKLGHGLNVNHPVHKAMEYMADIVEEKSEGRMRVEIFPNEQLGDEKECIEAVQMGYMAMTKTSTSPMEAFVPRIKIFAIPYLFRDSEHFWKVANGPIGKKLLLEGESKRLRGLCYYDAGARSFYAKKPIHSPADIKGKGSEAPLIIRVQKSEMARKLVIAMGGAPIGVSWGELYTSLDQGLVNAAENNPPSFKTSGHYEICKYYTLDEHTRVPDMMIISTSVWDNLSEEFQVILQDAVDKSVLYQREIWAEAEEADLEFVAEEPASVTIIRPDKQPFMDAVKPIWESFEGTEIGELIKEIKEVK